MEHVGPFTFNAVRFALGAAVLAPVVLLRHHRGERARTRERAGYLPLGGLAVGVVLFVASSLQQLGIVMTTAGRAGFITGLYVVIVPLIGLVTLRRVRPREWSGATVALIGLYVLTGADGDTIGRGDLLVLASACVFAVHVLLIDHYGRRMDAPLLAAVQFSVCAVASGLVALATETTAVASLVAAAVPIVYAGVFSSGIAYTLQVVGQRGTSPTVAAIIMSLEAVFAVAFGWLLLAERLDVRAGAGCALMLCGTLVSQFRWRIRQGRS